LLGVTTGGVTINGDSLLTRLPAGELAATPAAAHPLVLVRDAAVEQARAAEGVLARTDLPRLYLQSSVFARGSGAKTTGPFDPGVDGLGLERVNWAAGVQVIVPNVFDLTSLRARKTAAAASTRAEVALHDEAVLTVTSQQHTAEALLNTARAIAANTAIQRAAAQQSENQARARYDAGLAGIVDVADAQDLLAQADVQDQLAHVDVWRALLAVAVARGDLSSFLTVVRQP
jgi:outer membrane protein TolC